MYIQNAIKEIATLLKIIPYCCLSSGINFINPRCACAARITVVVLCLRVCVCVYVYVISFLPPCTSQSGSIGT